MREGDEATKVLGEKENFPANGTLVDVDAWQVPQSERYPEGIRYSMQYGRADDVPTVWEDGTIFRYDNFPDHPGASQHHKHTADGSVEDVEFPGIFPLYQQFKQEVRNHGEHWP